MFTTFTTARDALVSAFGALVFSTVLVAAAVAPAHAAAAATLGL